MADTGKQDLISKCPHCNSTEIYEVFTNKLFRCKNCNMDIKLINAVYTSKTINLTKYNTVLDVYYDSM